MEEKKGNKILKEYEFYISIGEPWNFVGPDGQNRIDGKIIKILNEECLVFKSNNIITIENLKGNIFICRPRYFGENYTMLDKKKLVPSNILLLMKEFDEKMKVEEIFQNAEYVIIGSITKKE
jgi:hypothetical protein